MSEIKVTLLHGYALGGLVLKNAFIRPYNTADLLDAEEESEKLVTVPTAEGEIEHKLVLSPALYGLNIFRRQIVRFEDVSGPFEIVELKKNLHRDDFSLLQLKIEELDKASIAKTASKAVTQRGENSEGSASN